MANPKLKPITKSQMNYHQKQSAKYIFVHDKDGNATCQKCREEIIVLNTKHKGKCKCPKCGANLNIHHEWRATSHPEIINWMCIPKVLDNHTLVLRFVMYHAYSQKMADDTWENKERISEEARMIIDEYSAEPEYYCVDWRTKKEWNKGKNPYFTTPSYLNNSRYIIWQGCYEYPRNWFGELNKLDCFKYVKAESVYEIYRNVNQLHYLVRSNKVNEMFVNAGYKELADYHEHYYYYHKTTYPVDNTKTNLREVLKLSKWQFKIWKNEPTIERLKYFQKYSRMNPEIVEQILDGKYGYYTDDMFYCVNKLNRNPDVINDYIKRKKTSLVDYKDYLKMLSDLKYNMKDKSYTMPSNYQKAEQRVIEEHREWSEIREAQKRIERAEKERVRREAYADELLKKQTEQSKLIKQISDGLKEMPELSEFLNGSRGLLVYVPESAEDLRNEGRDLHNCIHSYVDRVAEGKTLVFYIRQLNNPTAPFVAMEYCNGQVIQCRYDKNIDVHSVDDEQSRNIIDFAEAFAKTLRENNVLVG